MNLSLPQLLSKPHHDRWRYWISITRKYSIDAGHQHKRTIVHVRRMCMHVLEPSDGVCKQILAMKHHRTCKMLYMWDFRCRLTPRRVWIWISWETSIGVLSLPEYLVACFFLHVEIAAFQAVDNPLLRQDCVLKWFGFRLQGFKWHFNHILRMLPQMLISYPSLPDSKLHK